MNNRLNKTEIEKYLKYNIKVITVNETSSTNDDLKELAKNGDKFPVLLCADKQTKGRGRLGNSFFSPENGIYMSLLFFPEQFKDESLFITTMAACSVSSAIEKTTDKTTKIKWVNDIYTDNGKVCGILTESSFDAEKNVIDYFVLGVGVNLFSPIDGFPDELKGIASSLYEENSVYIDIKNKLIAEITNGFLDSLFSFNKEKHINEYKSKMLLLGKEISYKKNNKELDGIVIDIDNSLNLIVRNTSGKIDTLSSGEVKIKNWK